jgi:hypothetical protein
MDEIEFNERLGIRYSLDYRMIPNVFFKSPATMLGAFLNGDACALLSAIFNDVYEGRQVFTIADFHAERYMDEDDFVYLVTLPKENDSGLDRCTAYGFTFIRNGDDMAAQFFITKMQNDGDEMICGIDTNLERVEFCDALMTDKDNAVQMLRIAKSNCQARNPLAVEF